MAGDKPAYRLSLPALCNILSLSRFYIAKHILADLKE